LIVRVCTVDEVEAHPNADRMEVATIKGWKVCIGKGQFQKGDKVVYLPPDTVMPSSLAERLNVAKYLQPLPQEPDGSRPDGGRIRVARLRGEKSYGLVMACENPDWPVEHDVAEFYKLSKWSPPQPCTDGDAEVPHPAFFKYTDIENFRNFPHVIKEGEEVVFTEKLHGKNTRLAYIRVPDENGNETMEFMAGSHDVQRKEYVTFTRTIKDEDKNVVLDANGQPMTVSTTRRSQFWDCLTEPVKELLKYVSMGRYNVIVFGEMIGQGVQDMTYGTKFGFRAFDMMLDGEYLDHDEKQAVFDKFGVDKVPILYRGPFSKAKMEEFVDGPTTMCPPDQAGAFKGREGIVITPVKERTDFDLGGSGRVILKAVSFGYLERKNGTEFH
jgi:RNA ligase (TIGR02306 family)